MASISLKNICKIYPSNVKVVDDFSLDIADREFIVLVGPSGCGKSTTLRMIAGLEDISEGELYIGDRMVNKITPKNRDVAMVFQNYALYPHMNVFDNMSFGLRLHKTPKDEIKRKVEEAAEVLNISHLLNRKPKALSGGERQRVALGRAMVRDPAVFLLDEPLSNLDAKLRTAMRSEITKLHRRLGATFVYVTHDQTEAMTMGDRIVVMKEGVIQQVSAPQNLYDYPCNLFVAGFIGSPPINLLPATIQKSDQNYVANFGGNILPISPERFPHEKIAQYYGKEVILGIRPEDMYLRDASSAPLTNEAFIDAQVDLLELMGAETCMYVTCGNARLIAKGPSHKTVKLDEYAQFGLNCSKMHLFDEATERRI